MDEFGLRFELIIQVISVIAYKEVEQNDVHMNLPCSQVFILSY